MPRYDTTTPAVWTGSRMLLWHAGYGGNFFTSGARYRAASCTPDTWYRDVDGDGIGVATSTQSSCTKPTGYVAVAGDCNGNDALLWGTPGEARSLVLARNGGSATLPRTAPSSPGGSAAATRHDTLRGTVASNFTSAATCLQSDGTDLQSVDATRPAPQAAFYYLVRAVHSCPSGDGPLGVRSSGAPIAGRSCP